MPVTNHTVTVTLNGADRTTLLRSDSLYIRHSITNDSAVADFILNGSGAYTPIGWHSVSIAIDGTTVFGGYITKRDATPIGVGSTRQINWNIQCSDWSILLDSVTLSSQYTQTSDADIITNLFSEYMSDDGFDVSTNVQVVSSDIDIAFDRKTLRAALDQMAALVNAQWYIGPDKKLTWAAKDDLPAALYNIDVDTPNNTTTFDVAGDSFAYNVDETSVINRVTVFGGDDVSSERQDDTFASDGQKTYGAFSRKVSTMWSVRYVIGGVQQTIYTNNIGYEPGDSLVSDGGDYYALVNLDNRTVTVEGTSGQAPDSSTYIVASYYYSTPVDVIVNNTTSQTHYGRVFNREIHNDSLTNITAATAYAQSILDRYAVPRESISFVTYKHGLFPGTLVTVNADAFAVSGDYVIQEVEIHPVISKQGEFLMSAKVSCGDRQNTIIDVIKQASVAVTSSGANGSVVESRIGRLSSLTSNMGEIVSGRALFTDGGTAAFSWANYRGHTGVVVGLEDINGFTYGAEYILEGGTVRAKMGRMTGMPSIGTITPTGWGLWTTNGFFTGIIAAGTVDGAQVRGGTVTGSLITGGSITGGTITGAVISGGTINATVGNIGGFVVAANQMYSNGGTIATGSVVNSSNPGVYMGTAGLFGYGTIGLTFALYTDPTKTPYFSSGTINDAVYEVYQSGIIRTSSDVFANGGVQIDNSGIFGVNPTTGGALLLTEDGNILTTEDGRSLAISGVNFMLDATTGNLWAENAYINGVVYATDGSFTGTVFASAGSFTGTVTAAAITGGTVTGALISGGTVTGGLLSGGTVNGATIIAADGAVTINSDGLVLTAAQDANYDKHWVRWTDGGTVVAGIAAYPNTGEYYSLDTIGIQGTANGRKTIICRGTANLSAIRQTPDQIVLDVGLLNMLQVDYGAVSVQNGNFSVQRSLLPTVTNGPALGTTTLAYKALFLSDGTDEWKITINTSGVLTTLKV